MRHYSDPNEDYSSAGFALSLHALLSLGASLILLVIALLAIALTSPPLQPAKTIECPKVESVSVSAIPLTIRKYFSLNC